MTKMRGKPLQIYIGETSSSFPFRTFSLPERERLLRRRRRRRRRESEAAG